MTPSAHRNFLVGLLAPIAVAAGYIGAAASPSAASTGSVATHSAADALTAGAAAASAADIPDNQVFLTFRDTAGGYSIAFPEGWLQQGAGANVTFREKDNRLQIAISKGAAFSRASVKADVAALKSSTPSLKATPAMRLVLPSGAAFEVTYSTLGAANAVTGKRVSLVVDRYYLSKGGKRAIVELAAAKGADNVDAYRLIIKSFRWR
jgi:hypothetical protein